MLLGRRVLILFGLFTLFGCRSSTEPQPSAIASIGGRVLSRADIAVPASRVEVRCEVGEDAAEDEGVTSSEGAYAVVVTFREARTGDTATCGFASPTFAEPLYWAEADISLYPLGIPHPLQWVDVHELP